MFKSIPEDEDSQPASSSLEDSSEPDEKMESDDWKQDKRFLSLPEQVRSAIEMSREK